MSTRVRLAVFAAGAVGLAALFAWGFAGLPRFGDYRGPYGNVINRAELNERRATNVVASVVFDYRGFDTLGEELILVAAVTSVASLLRGVRASELGEPVDRVEGEAVEAAGPAVFAATALVGIYVVSSGPLTPGGGFQGGVVIAGAILLLWAAGDWRRLRRTAPKGALDIAEGTGAGAFAALGIAGLGVSGAFLANFVSLGKAGSLFSAGTISIANWAVGLAVAAAFALLFAEYLEEVMAERYGPRQE